MKSIPRNLAVAVATGVVVGLAACSPPGDPAEQHLSLTIPVVFLANDWDTAQSSPSLYGSLRADAVYDTLVVWDPATGTADPWLAEEFEMSDDRRLISIKLREDVDFVDGTHMDAAGVEKYFDNLLTSGDYALGGSVLHYGPEFTATGEYTLELTTETPIYPPEFTRVLLGVTPVLSPAALDDPERAMIEPMGSGPYLLDEVVPETEMSFVRNPDYWNPGAYPFDTVVLKVIEDPIAMLNAVKSGQIDVAPLTLQMVADAEASGLALHESGGTFSTLIVRDPATSDLPPLRDARVRQAMMWAFDREAINENINLGYGIVSSQAFVEGQPEFVPGEDRYGYDVERARELMAEAGYADGFDVVLPADTTTVDLEPIVQQSLGDIGIRVTFERMVDNNEFWLTTFAGEFPLVLHPIWDNANTLRFLTEQVPGIGSIFDPTPEVQELSTTIKEGDSDASAAASRELGELILDEAWYIPVSRPASYWASDPGIEIATNLVNVNVSLRGFTPAK